MNLQHIAERVQAKWICNDENYHGWNALPDDEARLAFRRRHVLHHLMKQVGKLAALQEAEEHDPSDRDAHRAARLEQAGKLITTALEYVSVCGHDVPAVERWIEDAFPSEPARA